MSSVHLTSHPEIIVVELHHGRVLKAPTDAVPTLQTSKYFKNHKAVRYSKNIKAIIYVAIVYFLPPPCNTSKNDFE